MIMLMILVFLLLLFCLLMMMDLSENTSSENTSSDCVEFCRITVVEESSHQQPLRRIQTKPSKDLVYNDKTGMFE